MDPTATWCIEDASLDRVLALRSAISYDGRRDVEHCVHPTDRQALTRHWVAVGGEEDIAMMTVAQESAVLDGIVAQWRLMLLGVDPRWRGRGVARALLLRAADHAAASGARYVWGRARTSVLPLYEQLGGQVVSAVYDLDGTGPHVDVVYGPLV